MSLINTKNASGLVHAPEGTIDAVNNGLYDPRFEHDACGVGFVAHIKGQRTHSIIENGLKVLDNLVHRGASGSDPETGDGAGILIQVPDALLRRECDKLGIALPAEGQYGVGMVFLPRDADARRQCEGIIESVTRREGLRFLGWRVVPTDSSGIGRDARAAEPVIKQFFIGSGLQTSETGAFNRKLYVVRRVIENEVEDATGMPHPEKEFYIPSLSARTLIYKGLLLPSQMRGYYADLTDPDMKSAIALVHQRFSTNTFPSWPLAHPYRFLAHNGEINTLRGNRNWMKAREAGLTSSLLGEDLPKCFPLVNMSGSDSATLDNAVELMLAAGRSLPHAMMMLIPEAWADNALMTEQTRAFYEYHACLMEPWDGPSAVAFTDGVQIGTVLDRNGLRPARYTITRDDLVVLASETGVIEFAPEEVVERGRLQPGKIFLVDTAEGRIIPDAEVKETICGQAPYGEWLERNRIDLSDLPKAGASRYDSDYETLLERQKAFGYTTEEVRLLIEPMAKNGEEPIGSMGTDTPLAVLSHRPQPLYNYFKQLFAQVTNPPIDPIRESLVMSLQGYIGRNGSLLDPDESAAHQVKLSGPILTNEELRRLRDLEGHWGDFRSTTLPMLFPVGKPQGSMERALERLCRKASEAIEYNYSVIVLSDKGVNDEYAPIPTLLAVSAVHHHLIREGTRTSVALVVESGEAREIHHFACLLGYGASAVNPYLVFDTITQLSDDGVLPEGTTIDKATQNYIKAVGKGLLKVMSKMGISTMQSYRGAQIFEAVGVSSSLIGRYFTGTPSRIEGIDLDGIEREQRSLHESAYPTEDMPASFSLEPGGQYQWRRYGEKHAFNPDSIAKMQQAVRKGSFETFTEFSKMVNDHAEEAMTLRGLIKFREDVRPPVPLEQVEKASEIVKRFSTGAMSLGSISRESHEGLAIAMNQIGGKSNTGEGGEDVERLHDRTRRSAIKQVASGRFGVTTEYLVNADEIQIKMAQGAKPGEGGQLPGYKVDEYIGKIRHTTPGVTLVSPPPHHDIYSIEDLAQLIFDLKNVNTGARISVKLVSEVGVGTIAAGVAKAHADHILIAGYEGGTGASPLSSIKHCGLPWELGLAETQQVLVLNDLRGRVRLATDGQMKTGRDVIIAALLGAEEFGFSSAPLVAQGCIMMRVCHLGTCPVGIATQDPILRKKFEGKPEHVINYFFFVAEEVRRLMAELGFRTVDEMIGQVGSLNVDDAVRHWKARGVHLAAILHEVKAPNSVAIRKVQDQDHGLTDALDYRLIENAKPALEDAKAVEFTTDIHNYNRTCGTMLSGEVAKRYGDKGLAKGTIVINFHGSSGQSFGAFLVTGMTLNLLGDANDYLGKGMSGGRIIVRPPHGATFPAHDNIIAGNTLLYGATGGEVYLSGKVGERFAVRNSGAKAVVEGVGDHGCEYMTGGTVVILGETGRNFAAGMSGGAAFIYDPAGTFGKRINKDKNLLRESVTDEADIEQLRWLIAKHQEVTESVRATYILDNWETELPNFVKVISEEYKKLLAKRLATPLPVVAANDGDTNGNGNGTATLPADNPAPAYTSPAGKG